MRYFVLLLSLLVIPAAAISQSLPEVQTDIDVWPSEIFLAGTGMPDEAEVTLLVEGIGDTIPPVDIDLIFAIDVSGSMAGAPMVDAKNAATFICRGLGVFFFAQSGLVAFSDSAVLVSPLSRNHEALILLIDGLTANGGTAMGDAINLAQQELTGPRHRAGNLRVVLLLSDGSSNRGANPIVAAHNAKTTGTLIYALGIGNPVEDAILRIVVSDPDSLNYWSYPNPTKYEEILRRILGVPTYLAAREMTVSELIDSRLNYVPGSFSIGPDSTIGETVAWSVGELGSGDMWQVSFRVTASDTGQLPVEQLPTSRAHYKNFAGAWIDTPFPQAYVNVVMGVGVEEDLNPTRVESIFELGPNPFREGVTITYFGDGFSRVMITVHDLAGRLVRTLVDDVPATGSHAARWQGTDNQGTDVAAGAYVCRYESAGAVYSRILLYLK